MANKYCNLIGYNKVSDEYSLITQGFNVVDADVSALQTEVSEIVRGDANAEVGQAHVSTVKGEVFETIKDRFEAAETDTISLQNEVLNSVPVGTVSLSTESPVASIDAKVSGGLNFEMEASPLLVNIVKNGNFANGTTGWTTTGSTLSVANNILSVTGSGSVIEPDTRHSTGYSLSTGRKIYVRAELKVTNSDCTEVAVYLHDNAAFLALVEGKASPAINQAYTFSGVYLTTGNVSNLVVRLRHVYSSAAIANGKVMEAQRVMAVDISDYPVEKQTQVWCDANLPYVNGIQPMMGLYLQSCGKNLFDKGSLMPGQYNGTNTSTHKHSGLIPLVVGNQYYFSGNHVAIRQFDSNRNYISVVNTTTSRAYTANYPYIMIENYYGLTETYFDDIQLEEGTTVTAYEPYQGSELLVDGEFAGIDNYRDKLSYENGVAKKLAKVKKYVLQASDITNLITSQVAVDYIIAVAPPDCINLGSSTALTGYVKIAGKAETILQETIPASDAGNFFTGFASSQNRINFIASKGTYASLAAAQAALAGTEIWYVLAQPIEEILPTPINGWSVYKGKTTISLQTGIVKEKANPIFMQSTSKYYINRNTSVAIDTTASKTKCATERIKSILKNGIENINNWLITRNDPTAYAFGRERAEIPQANFDPTATYEVLYEALPEEYNNQQAAITAEYVENLLDSHNELVKTVSNVQANVADVWLSLLPLAEKELKMAAVANLTTETTTDLKNKINEILNIW